jgi:hypothetical protein
LGPSSALLPVTHLCSPSPATHLCSALLPVTHLCSPSPATAVPLRLRLRRGSAPSSPPLHHHRLRPEHFFVAASSPVSSPSPVAVHAPLSSPPLLGGPHEPVVHLRPHLLRRQPSIRTTAGHLLPPVSAAVTSLLRWALVPSNASHRSLMDPVSPTASPSLLSHHRPADGISPAQHGWRKVIEGPLLQLMG